MLRAFRSRDYLRFWSGSFVASVGTWMQQIALGWLVFSLTRSASSLGVVSFAGNSPILVLGLVGGAVADRASRRAIMVSALLVIAATAVGLALLTATGHIAVWQVIAIAFVAGTASALFAPSMQSVIPSLVEPADLLEAISLNSVQFNLARTLGPALAGLLYDVIGPAGCFAANAACALVMTSVVARLRVPDRPAGAPPPLARALRDGIGYAVRHPVIGPSLLLAAVMSVFGFPYIVLLPALAGDGLGLDASGLGYLMAAVGGGAVLAGLGLSAVGDIPRKGFVATVCAVVFGLVLACFAVVRSVAATRVLLFFLGALQTVTVASLNTTLQIAVDEGMRGRVMSMVTVIFFGFTTIGGLLIGVLADQVGIQAALAAGGVVIALAATAVLLRAPALPRRVEI